MGERTQRACPRCPRSPARTTPFPPEASSRAGSTLAQTPTCPTLLSDKDMMRKLSCNLMNVCYFALLDSILPDTDKGHPSRLLILDLAGVCWTCVAEGPVQRCSPLCKTFWARWQRTSWWSLLPNLLEGCWEGYRHLVFLTGIWKGYSFAFCTKIFKKYATIGLIWSSLSSVGELTVPECLAADAQSRFQASLFLDKFDGTNSWNQLLLPVQVINCSNIMFCI